MRFDITIITSALTAARRANCDTLIKELGQSHGVQWRYEEAGEPETVDRAFLEANIKLERHDDPRLEQYNKYLRNLHIRSVSNNIKHRAALERIAGSQDADVKHLVLEDDVIAGQDWVARLEKTMADAPGDAAIIALGVPSSNQSPFQELGDVYEVLPCCDSYFVTPAAARALHAAYLPYRYATNIQLTYLAKTLKLPTYLVHPNVFLDGSKYGAFISVLNPGNQLILNGTYMTARRQLLDEDARDPAVLAEIGKTLADSPFGSHPDFMHLRALVEWRTKGAAAARDSFKGIVEVYDANNALVTNESQFLRDYIRLHRDLQDSC
mgnify:CR=1 FL=1